MPFGTNFYNWRGRFYGQVFDCFVNLCLSNIYKLANRAALFLRRSYQPIEPRKQWPVKDMFTYHQSVTCHLEPTFTIGEGDSTVRYLIVLSICDFLIFIVRCIDGIDKPSSALSSTSRIAVICC
jgi:hypothetical protein